MNILALRRQLHGLSAPDVELRAIDEVCITTVWSPRRLRNSVAASRRRNAIATQSHGVGCRFDSDLELSANETVSANETLSSDFSDYFSEWKTESYNNPSKSTLGFREARFETHAVRYFAAQEETSRALCTQQDVRT